MKRAKFYEDLRLKPEDLVGGMTPADLEARLIEETANAIGEELGRAIAEDAKNWEHDGDRWWWWNGTEWVRMEEETEQ